jgi:hypothetical protein
MRRPMTLTDTSERETVRVAPGDTVYVLSPVGEGYTRLWVRGKIVVEEEFWAPPGQDDPADPAFKARLLRDADSKWWVKVRTRTGRLGWIDMDQARETGADACG